MQVYKLCMKIFKKNMLGTLIYVAVFIFVALLVFQMYTPAQLTDFSQSKTNMALILEEDTPLTRALEQQLSGIAVFKDIEDETENLQDALFFREVSYILRVPKGFTASFLSGGSPEMEKTILPGSFDTVYADTIINQFMNLARLYRDDAKGMSQEEIFRNVGNDMSNTIKVNTQQKESNGDLFLIKYHFNYLAYTFIASITMSISTILLVFNNVDIKRRSALAPINAHHITMQFILASLTFTLAIWIVMVSFTLALDYKELANINTIYFILNSFVFMLSVAGIAFLIGNLVKGREAVAAVSNIVTLGSSFLCGVFIPQELMGETVLKIASFTPTYWYVRANEKIVDLTQLSWSDFSNISSFLAIELGFAACFFILALVAGKRKRLSTQNA